ncbi:MAG: hypothetical protein M0001_09860 [Treponema sp.]|nr:hypothetical protein [Treponema sp.]
MGESEVRIFSDRRDGGMLDTPAFGDELHDPTAEPIAQGLREGNLAFGSYGCGSTRGVLLQESPLACGV